MWCWSVFWKFVKKTEASFECDENDASAAHEQQYKCVIVSLTVLLRVENISHKRCIENQNTHSVFFFFFQNCAVCETEWKNIAELGRLQFTVRRVHSACRITKATDTHSEHVILIAFPLQQCLHKHTSLLTLHAHWLSCHSTSPQHISPKHCPCLPSHPTTQHCS